MNLFERFIVWKKDAKEKEEFIKHWIESSPYLKGLDEGYKKYHSDMAYEVAKLQEAVKSLQDKVGE